MHKPEVCEAKHAYKNITEYSKSVKIIKGVREGKTVDKSQDTEYETICAQKQALKRRKAANHKKNFRCTSKSAVFGGSQLGSGFYG